jgi:hypothetical protein
MKLLIMQFPPISSLFGVYTDKVIKDQLQLSKQEIQKLEKNLQISGEISFYKLKTGKFQRKF